MEQAILSSGLGSEDERRLFGIGFMIKTAIARKQQNFPVGHSDRIMSLRRPIQDNKFATVHSVYATMQAETGVNEAFYRGLHNLLCCLLYTSDAADDC